MESLKKRLAKKQYLEALRESDNDIKFHLYFESLNLLAQTNREPGDGNRQAIRRLIESHLTAFEADIDFEDFRLDVFYERPVFSDLHVEEDRDVYYYEDFNTNKTYRTNDDNVLSIKTFQRILEDSDMNSFYMSIYKVHDYLFEQNKNEYTEYEKRLIIGSNYLLESALKNLFDEN